MSRPSRAAYQREWRARNPEKVSQSKKNYRLKHPQKVKEMNSIYKWKNRERIRELNADYRARHKEEKRLYNERWNRINAEKRTAEYLAAKLPYAPCCELCPNTENLQHHHPDHSEPLIVLTVCASCHKYVERSQQELN